MTTPRSAKVGVAIVALVGVPAVTAYALQCSNIEMEEPIDMVDYSGPEDVEAVLAEIVGVVLVQNHQESTFSVCLQLSSGSVVSCTPFSPEDIDDDAN